MMKKTTVLLALLLTFNLGFSQTWSTGTVNLSANFNAKIDITSTNVKLTLNAPDNIWFGIGFGGSSMGTADILRTDGTILVDASPTASAFPVADTNQDWIQDSNTTSGGVRTIVAHRVLNTGEVGDYVFSASNGSIPLIWAKGSSTSYGYHPSRGATVAGVTLDVNNEIALNKFKLFPNPCKTILNLQLPSSITNDTSVEIFNSIGKQVYSSNIKHLINSKINISNWNNGIYLIKVSSYGNSRTKRLIKI